MDGLGDRLRARARELGWSDAEVARRAGLAQTRYANYVTDRHEPDLATLLRICAVLGASASDLLSPPAPEASEASRLRGRISAAAQALDATSLGVLVIVADGLVARAAQASPAGPAAEPPPARAGTRKGQPPARLAGGDDRPLAPGRPTGSG